jgi:hypothetical protein
MNRPRTEDAPSFSGWCRPSRGHPWRLLARAATRRECLFLLLARMPRGGTALVTENGRNPNLDGGAARR